jgi:hypothetical protein
MKALRLIRVAEFNDATLGVFLIDGRPLFVTLEDKWRDNERQVSCIPKGRYKIVSHVSPRFGKCYKVADVPNRTDILIHAGNTHKDTHGCILLGLMYGSISSDAAILSSRVAIDNFMTEMGGTSEAILEVV